MAIAISGIPAQVNCEPFTKQKDRDTDNSKKWSVVQKKRPQRVIVGKTLSTSIQCKNGSVAQRHERKTDSLYVGNLQPTVVKEVHDYIKNSFKKCFGNELKYLQVYSLISKTKDDVEVVSSSFRVIIDQQDKQDLFNPLVWPNYVIVRAWKYNSLPCRR